MPHRVVGEELQVGVVQRVAEGLRVEEVQRVEVVPQGPAVVA